ncbi:mandelate racemase/muconate lactonizing enzyme family protein [Bosea sp. (in: a-proteobacteria)]|uniref:mandelate racemase/muconate lactonizing enzyme family protein n=1 Tax=Bosea sp. (in: a-proteobacteria) TaxID=1871050 RepID=UPI002611CC0D|nr:mandelate racemase/muconate lactonizing enzyme family protein [Bosea sp. (in: a-proteobacteria)]MCO5090996.1 mandelate racemase/muconate lactonizing enzyme family protein [Bosea sp. (in: a-proteobacteria)]
MKVTRVTATPLLASFAGIFGGADKVPPHIRVPAAHFRRIPRMGQMSTLVEVESDDGVIGYGEAFGLPHPLSAAAIVNEVVAPALLGEEIGEPAGMTQVLYEYFFALGSTRGAAMEALSGVDIALWDLKARAAGLPLSTLLGASPGPVSTYASPVGFHEHPEDSARAALDFLKQGFTAIKIKIGRGAETDALHVGAVRDVVGPAVKLYADVNCAYDVQTAIAVAEALEPFDLGWFEEPIPPDDPQGLAEVRRHAPMPVAAGENEFSPAAFRRLIDAGALDFAQPNITRAGGVSAILEIGRMCADAGVKLAPHGVGSCISLASSLNACRAAAGFATYEANRLINPLRDEMGLHPWRMENGMLMAADRPGHGGEPDMAEIDAYRIGAGA